MKLALIGISGPSSSGKSTVVKNLVTVLPHCTEIHLDDFYFPGSQIPVDEKHGIQNWDCAEALDWEKFKNHLELVRNSRGEALTMESLEIELELALTPEEKGEIQTKINHDFPGLSSCHVVLVDGFMLYHDATIAQLLDVKLLFRAPYATLKSRRELRLGYNTIEGFWADPPGYFENIVWPAYIASHRHLFLNGDVSLSLSEEAKILGIQDVNNDGSYSLAELVTEALEIVGKDIEMN